MVIVILLQVILITSIVSSLYWAEKYNEDTTKIKATLTVVLLFNLYVTACVLNRYSELWG